MLSQLLALDRTDPLAVGNIVFDRYGDTESLPAEWAEPLVKACMDESRSREQRLQLMYQLVRLPAHVVTRTISSHLYLDSGLVRNAVRDGDDFALIEHLDDVLPGYDDVPVVRMALGQELFDAVAGTRGAEANFSKADDDAIDWIDNPHLVPIIYDIPNTCATCTTFYPRAITDEGILGECAKRSAGHGLFAHCDTCEKCIQRPEY